jgi:hypothetical protein
VSSLVHVTALTQYIDDDDEWSDVTSSEGASSPTKEIRNVDGDFDPYESPDEATTKLLPYSSSYGLPNNKLR